MSNDHKTIPVIEEELVVTKRELVTGTVTVRTETTTEEVDATATLNSDSVEVTRVPIDREVTGVRPTVRTEGTVTIIPVVAERLVVEKKLILVEEIHISRQVMTENVTVPVSLRKQQAVIERIATPIQTDEEPK